MTIKGGALGTWKQELCEGYVYGTALSTYDFRLPDKPCWKGNHALLTQGYGFQNPQITNALCSWQVSLHPKAARVPLKLTRPI